ncbi:hypothetical protein REMIM1_CH01090 [Rhizobium etli bv. mimosae str. Mim1]|nr:hypothetical protein REMIM1_CH01090 [Rhizobium etli bv. mimosae str. Mim1]
MPMSFAALLGGLMTQVGMSPNIVVSQASAGDGRNILHHVRLHADRRNKPPV